METQELDDQKTEQLHQMVREINDQGVFKIDLEWAFDHDRDTNEVSEIFALITAGWSGKKHVLEFSTEDNNLLEPLLDFLNGISKLKELS